MWGGLRAPRYAGPPRLSQCRVAPWRDPSAPSAPSARSGVLTRVSPQRCSASCSPTWRVAWPGVTAPTGRPMTGSTSWPTPATPTVPWSLVRGTRDGGRGCWTLEGAWGRGCQSPGDVGTGLLEPGGHGDVGTGLLEPGEGMETGLPEPRGRGDGDAGAQGTWGQDCWSLNDIKMGLPEPGGRGDKIAGAWGRRGGGAGVTGSQGTWGQGSQSHGDVGMALPVPPSPAALGDRVGAHGGHRLAAATAAWTCCLLALS